jgi:hypothetical protein
MVSVCRDSQPPIPKLSPKSYGEVSWRKYSGEVCSPLAVPPSDHELLRRSLLLPSLHDDEDAVTDFCFGKHDNCASFLDYNLPWENHLYSYFVEMEMRMVQNR